MEWYEKNIVLKANAGTKFKISKDSDGTIIIEAINTVKKLDDGVYCKNYANPPIPKGYNRIFGVWDTGIVIQRNSDKSQFVWVPVASLESDGTIDGKHFIEKFGRRAFRGEKITYYLSESSYIFYEDAVDSFVLHEDESEKRIKEQFASVRKYGGFYISRFNISIGEDGKPHSLQGVMPKTNISYPHAEEIADTFEDTEGVKSHLPFGAEYDSILSWFYKSGAKTYEEIAEDSSNWGNFYTTRESKRLLVTGSSEKYSVNHIYDFAGNVREFTQEQYNGDCRFDYLSNKPVELHCPVVRGGSYKFYGDYPAAYRGYVLGLLDSDDDIGFRVSLYMK